MNTKRHPPTFMAFFSVTILVLSFMTSSAIASDLAKEKRWAEQISDSLLDGDTVMLNDGKNDFLAIDTRAEDAKDVGIIVIHGIGIYPDWPTVIQPLRVELAALGWNTLSLQMPILGNDASSEDYAPLMKDAPERIDAGIRYLFKEGAKKVVIVAHSMGAHMASYYLAHKNVYMEAQTETPIIAYIGIGMGSEDIQHLANIKLPVLDLMGEKDLADVLASAPKRLKAASHNKAYQQKIVSGADHFFEEMDDVLVETVKSALLKF